MQSIRIWLVLAALSSACLRHGQQPASTPKIYGGTPVAPGELPAVVALTLQAAGGSGPSLSCSGTLIAPTVVLTAGHCLKGPGFDATTLGDKLKEQLHIYFGDGFDGGALPASATVAAVAVHPMLREHPIGYADYGLVFLDAPVRDIQPIPVVTDLEGSLQALRGKTTTLIGYGERDDRAVGRKFQVEAAIISYTSAEAVVGGGGKDACGGDSGGPALVKAAPGRWALLGSVSRGIHLGCGDGGTVSLASDGWCWIQQAAAGRLVGPVVDCAPVQGDRVQTEGRRFDFLQLCQNKDTPATQRETIHAVMLGLASSSCADTAQKLHAAAGLNLDYLMIRDLTPLAQLSGVTRLSLKGNRISDVSPLGEVNGLQRLELDGNQVESTAALAALEEQGLQIFGTKRQLGNFFATDFLRACQDGGVSAAAQTTVKAIFYKTQSSDCSTANERLLSMKTLTLNDRQLSDVSPLAGLEQILVLDLSGNPQLSEIPALAGLEHLQTLNLTGTKVTDLSPLNALRARGLTVVGP